MSYIEMTVSGAKLGIACVRAYEATVLLTSATSSGWVLIPSCVQTITVTVEPTGTTAKVQATTDTVSSVKDNTAVGIDWSLGDVSVAKQDSAIPVTAFRLVQNGAGSSKMTMRAQ